MSVPVKVILSHSTRDLVTGRSNGPGIQFHGAWRPPPTAQRTGLSSSKGPLEAAQWVDWGCTALVCVFQANMDSAAVYYPAWYPEAYRDVPPPYRVGSDSSPGAGTDGRPCLVRPHGRTSSSNPPPKKNVRPKGDTTQVRRHVPGAPRQTRLCYTNGVHTQYTAAEGKPGPLPHDHKVGKGGLGRGRDGGSHLAVPPAVHPVSAFHPHSIRRASVHASLYPFCPSCSSSSAATCREPG